MQQQTTSIRIAVVEDFKLQRMGIVAAIAEVPDFELAGEFESAEDALTGLASQPVDLILLDLGLPGMSGQDAIPQFRGILPDVKIVVLTSHDTRQEVMDAFANGANAYCMKDIESDRFAEVIRAVYEGALWLDPAVAQYALETMGVPLPESIPNSGQSAPSSIGTLASSATSGLTAALPSGSPSSPPPTPDTPEPESRFRFTPKEREVIPLLAEGRSNTEIAQALGISVHTVKVHVSNILEKLDVYDRVQAAVKIVREGLE